MLRILKAGMILLALAASAVLGLLLYCLFTIMDVLLKVLELLSRG
jgi:hypothetical protein